VPADGNLRICFGSVFYFAKVWLDGRLLGEHEGGYLPFSYTAPGVTKGLHTLVVRADNRLTDRSLPKKNVDWFPYGGIDRPVYAEIVAPLFIERFHVIPSKAALKVRVFVRNLGADAAPAKLAFSVDGKELYAGTHRVAPGAATVEFEAVLKEPRLWSPRSPNLYSARVVLDRDDQFTRFGVRAIRTEGTKILLNGERLRLMGANRHEDHPDWGSASPPHLIRQDIEIIKRLGANAVRAHYALPELFMDYCDQYGLVFLSEAPAWQYSPQQLGSTEIQEKMLHYLEEMVARDMNHPSVLTWSLGNEWPEPDRSYDVIRGLIERARTLDGTRLITLVTGGPKVWRVHELIDVISVNWARYQWYDPFTTLDRAEGEKSVVDLNKIHARYPNKPVILTELGGAESQAGWHNWGNVKWSEEFQARNVEDSAWYALDQDWISGGCVWQFSDTRSAPERILAGRLHGWNGKGVLDAYRSPKLAFYRLQQVFRSVAESASGNGGR
jgi:beta-glucuronidase